MQMQKPSQLRQLADIISASVDHIDKTVASLGTAYPSVNDIFNPMSPSEQAAMNPDIIPSAMMIVAACDQLLSTVNIPAMSLYGLVGGFHLSSAIRTAVETNMVEILREGGPQGVNSEVIATKTGVPASKVSRVLRLLSTHHVFRELAPDVFTNNRLSSMMDTLKSVAQIQAAPKDKHDGTPGMAALVESTLDELMKGSAIMTEVLMDKVTGPSEDAKDAPVMVAYKSNKPYFDWIDEPENQWRMKRFASGMEGAGRADPPNAILMGFDWATLPDGATIVDVGGGTGGVILKIAQSKAAENKHFKLIVQDRPTVIKQANEFWGRERPSALQDGTVTLQSHDFFTPQPVKNANIFVMRMILHDHGNIAATKILKNLRASAKPDTKLIIVEQIVPYSSGGEATRAIGADIPGSQMPEPPAPLLPNAGKANAIAYIGDFQMLIANNGEERTIGTFIGLTGASGWKIERVYPIPGSLHKQIVAVPA